MSSNLRIRYDRLMDVLSYLNELRGGVTPGAASDQDFVGWSHAESESQIARNAHRLNQGLELAARLEELGWGQRGPLLRHYSKLTGRKKSVLYDRAATAKKLLALLARAGEVSGFPESSVLDVAWDGLLAAFEAALGLESESSGRGSSGDSGGLVDLWVSWLDKMADQAGDDVASLEKLEQLLAEKQEEVRRLLAEARAGAVSEGEEEASGPAVERGSGPVREAPEDVLDAPTLATGRPVELDGEGERERDTARVRGRRRRR